jgi:hypothetical protein
MEAIAVKDEDVARYVGRKLKINRGDEEFIGMVSGSVDINNQQRWIIDAENDSMHFLPREGWLVYAMDD